MLRTGGEFVLNLISGDPWKRQYYALPKDEKKTLHYSNYGTDMLVNRTC
jgi:hypothetical protein